MSHMEYVKGTVQEQFPDIDGEVNKANALADYLGITREELYYGSLDDEFEDFKDKYYEKYVFANGRLFDMADAPIEEFEDQERDHVRYLGKGKYEVDFIYYNGGANFAEMFTPWLEKQERGEAGIEPYFVEFVETNDNEGESWSFWLQLDGNEQELRKLAELLDSDEFEECYSIDMNAVPEHEVDIIVKHSGSGYMAYHNKVEGKFIFPESDDDKGFYYSVFYKGGIATYFKEVQ